MSGSGSVRVLMLGWEYPPRFVGGLGKASQGIARGLAALGADVRFVLPRLRRAQGETRLRVCGAREWLRARGQARVATPQWLGVASALRPYARPRPTTPPAPALADADAVYGGDLDVEVDVFAQRVLAIAADIGADLVHGHDWMTFPAAVAVADAQRLPLFLHVHSTEYDRAGSGANPAIATIERDACRRADHVFAVSDYTRGILIERYRLDAAKVSVAYNAPDGDGLPPALPFDAGARRPWVVFLGRLTFQKGPDHFLRAAAQVARLNPDACFIVCGAGDMRDDLQRLAQQLGIAERVEFRGFLAPGAVDRLLARSALLVMPSVSEPFGLVALEALQAGTPVVLSRQSGVREVLGPGLQVDFWDHDRLADQILAVLRLPVLARQLVDEGRAHLQRLSWEQTAQRILDGYAQVGGRARGDPA